MLLCAWWLTLGQCVSRCCEAVPSWTDRMGGWEVKRVGGTPSSAAYSWRSFDFHAGATASPLSPDEIVHCARVLPGGHPCFCCSKELKV